MFYLVYKITNTINNKIYIGCHKTRDKNDGYFGSGKYLKRAISKYGVDSFIKEIIFEASSAEEMFEKEKELVEIGPHTYNLKKGGDGGFDFINKNITDEQRKRIGKLGSDALIKRLNEDSKFREEYIERNRKQSKELHKKGLLRTWKDTYSWIGKKHKEESKKKIGEKNSIHQKGLGNSQYGTMWITNGIESIRIKKNDIIPEGWKKGRVIKNIP
jgi:group I intron endonuclease